MKDDGQNVKPPRRGGITPDGVARLYAMTGVSTDAMPQDAETLRRELEAARTVAYQALAREEAAREHADRLERLVAAGSSTRLPGSGRPREAGGGKTAPEASAAQAQRLWEGDEPPPRRWFVAGYVPEKSVSILSGHSGLGKSYVALYLAMCVCQGVPFFNDAVQRARVLWIDRELDHDELKRRAFQLARGMGLDRPPEGLLYYRPERPIGSRRTQDQVQAIIAREGVELCILDSLSVGSSGRDMAEQKDTVEVMKMIEAWGTTLAIDHITKEGARGNQGEASIFGSAFKRAIARSTMKLLRADGGGLTLRGDKASFTAEQPPVHFAMDFLTKTAAEGSSPVRAVRLRRLMEFAPELLGAEQNMPAHEQTLHALARLYEGDPVTLEALSEERDLTAKTLRNHLSLLRKTGRVEMRQNSTYVPVDQADDYRLGGGDAR